MLKILYFFRKPIQGYHSIEELFTNIIRHLPGDIQPNTYILPFISKGNLRRFLNIFAVLSHRGNINHITGDVHYISFFLNKKRTILTIHDLEIIKRSNPIKKYLILLFWYIIPAKRVKYITVISEFTKQELLNYTKVPTDKIKVIPNCIPGNIPYFPKSFNSISPVILQVGTKHNKNLPNLIYALEGIKCKLIILGKLELTQEKLLKQYNINYENIYGLPYNEVIEVYKKIDILTFISTYEGFGLPILEAQSTGRVVLTSNISSMPEVAGKGALFVNPYEVNEIRDAIKILIESVELREQLITNGLENIKRFQPKIVAEKYAELYRKVSLETKHRNNVN